MASSCPQCSRPVDVAARFCTGCGSSLSPSTGTTPAAGPSSLPVPSSAAISTAWQPTGSAQGPTFAPASSVPTQPTLTISTSSTFDPSSIRLAHGEVIKRTYPVGRSHRPLGWIEGQLVVTDARILYRAHAKSLLGASTNCREIQIADVRGLGLVTRKGMSPLSFLTLTAGFLIWSAIIYWLNNTASMYTGGGVHWWAALLFLLVIVLTAAFAALRLRATEVVLVVYARDVSASPIALSGALGNQSHGLLAMLMAMISGPPLRLMEWLGIMDAADASDSADLDETQTLYDEFGALILDLQNRGVMGAP